MTAKIEGAPKYKSANESLLRTKGIPEKVWIRKCDICGKRVPIKMMEKDKLVCFDCVRKR